MLTCFDVAMTILLYSKPFFSPLGDDPLLNVRQINEHIADRSNSQPKVFGIAMIEKFFFVGEGLNCCLRTNIRVNRDDGTCEPIRKYIRDSIHTHTWIAKGGDSVIDLVSSIIFPPQVSKD